MSARKHTAKPHDGHDDAVHNTQELPVVAATESPDDSLVASTDVERSDTPVAQLDDTGELVIPPTDEVEASPPAADEVDKVVIANARPDETAPIPAIPMSAPSVPSSGDPAATAVASDVAEGPANAPGREAIAVSARPGADTDTGSTDTLSWSARSDVGLVRGHNEDSFLVRAPVFCVCDGMGGHEAGEVASAIATRTILEQAPATADDTLLGAAIESANAAIIAAAEAGEGKPGMGCTATAIIIEGTKAAIAHVGDSRAYVLHNGALVRVTHDHSFVEELVDAGEITADEARVHPSRSVITRALGNDPDMYADHFMLDVEQGDRIILCSDGLSSMIADSALEAAAVSSATAQQACDNLVAAALVEGGHDNVTVVVVDVIDDGTAAARRKEHVRLARQWLMGVGAVLLLMLAFAGLYVFNSWYVSTDGDNVAIYHGVNTHALGLPLSRLSETSSVLAQDLPEATQKQLDEGIRVASADEAHDLVESYRDQIDAEKTKAAETASNAKVAGAEDEAPEGADTVEPAKPDSQAAAQPNQDGTQGGD